MTRWLWIAAAFGTAGFPVAQAQDAPAAPAPPAVQPDEEDYMRPTETGVRFTPGMARAMGKVFAREALAREYGVNEEDQKKAAEKLARNLMRLAHTSGRQGQQFFEYAFETLMENQGRFTPESGKRWAELSRPTLPALREFMSRTAEELRPLIPPDKQIRFAGEMMKASLAIDMYEKKMERWAQGKVGERENPFEPDSEETATAPTDPNESKEVREARRHAENSLKWDSTGRWRQYVESTIQYYKLDEAQRKTAESILREMEDRAKQVQTDEWKARILLNRTKLNLSYRGMNLWSTPWMWQLEREYEDLLKPIKDLTRELQDRLETLPTTEQRSAAQARMTEEFAKRGMKE